MSCLWEPKWSVTKKRQYYFNTTTGQSSWEPPLFNSQSSHVQSSLAVTNPTLFHSAPVFMADSADLVQTQDSQGAENSPGTEVTIARVDKNGDAAVAAHYDRITLQSRHENIDRDNTRQLRAFNNWVKAWLINKYGQGTITLDLACGRGQDLNKWARARCPQYLGVDVSLYAVDEAVRRVSTRGFNFAKVIQHNLATEPCIEFPCDVVSCMFAFHYFWQSEEALRCFLTTVTKNLRNKGRVLLTFPDAAVIKFYLMHGTVENGVRVASNELFQIEMQEQQWQNLNVADSNNAFGWSYTFTLKNAVERCVEHLVIVPVLQVILAEFQLHILKIAPFQQFYHELAAKNEFMQELRDMRVTDTAGGIPEAQWETVGLYQVVVLQLDRVRDLLL